MTTTSLAPAPTLTESLALIPPAIGEYGPWWGSQDGTALLDNIHSRLSGRVARTVFTRYGVLYERTDVTHSAIVLLSDPQVMAAVAGAVDPWAYLRRVLQRELTRQVGPFRRVPNSIEALYTLYDQPVSERPYTDLMKAAHLTSQCLLNLTPLADRPHLDEVVSYLARRGGHRLSRAGTEVSRDADLLALGFTARQLRAVVNAVIGSHPDFSTNSLLAGYLCDSSWDPWASPGHARALQLYERRMHRDEMAKAA